MITLGIYTTVAKLVLKNRLKEKKNPLKTLLQVVNTAFAV